MTDAKITSTEGIDKSKIRAKKVNDPPLPESTIEEQQQQEQEQEQTRNN